MRASTTRRAVLGCMAAGLVASTAAAGLKYADSAEAVKPLGVGAFVPDVSLTTLKGETVGLKQALAGKPTILVFYRGGWCPFCMRHLAGLQQVYDRLGAEGYQLVAVSPDSTASVAAAAAKSEVGYTLLSDLEMEAISAFGLAFKLSPETLVKYRDYGIKLLPTPGTEDRILPVPAVYLVDASGRIEFLHADPDYRKRLDPHAVIAAARGAAALRSTSGVTTESIEYRDGDTLLEGYLAYPAGLKEPRPGVLVFHEWWGLNDYARARARQLAKLGYVALAADVYGKGTVTESAEEAGRLAGIYKGDRNLIRQRGRAALAVLAKHSLCDGSRVAALGYCFGGTCALELTRSGADLRGMISFHGGLDRDPDVENGEIRARVLVCHGAADSYVPASDVAALQVELDEAGADWQMVLYGGAVHSFTSPGAAGIVPRGALYHPLADVRSWEHMRGFLAEVFE